MSGKDERMNSLETLIAQLKEAAAKATPGDWCPSNIADPHDNMIEQRDVSAFVDGPVICTIEDCHKANQVYIALCSPENILTLITELERLREMEREARELLGCIAQGHTIIRLIEGNNFEGEGEVPIKEEKLITRETEKARAFLSKWAAPGEGEKKND